MVHPLEGYTPSFSPPDFYRATGMTPTDFTAVLENYAARQDAAFRDLRAELRQAVSEFRLAWDGLREARAEHIEMARKLDEHERQLHGLAGQQELGLVIRTDRIERWQKEREAVSEKSHNRAWDVISGLLIGVLGLLAAHWLDLKP